MITVLSGIAFVVLGILLIVLIGVYTWLSIQEILVILRNYNFTRARYCNPKSCGLYHHREDDPASKDCLSPIVSRPMFDRLSINGDRPGCRHSMKVREVKTPRAPALQYKSEYMEAYEKFHASRLAWRIVVMLATIFLYVFGYITSRELIQIFF